MSSNYPSCDLKVESILMLFIAVSVRSRYIIFVPNCHFILLYLLVGSTITFICETCASLRFEKDCVSRHLEVEEAVIAL